jgi:hypothetical protein
LELIVLWSAQVTGKRQTDNLTRAPQHLDGLVVVKSSKRLAVNLNDLVVDLNSTRQIRNAARVDTFDKDARQFLCVIKSVIRKDLTKK